MRETALTEAYAITEKQQRHARIGEIKDDVLATLAGGDDAEVHRRRRSARNSSISNTASCASASCDGEPRIDGRDTKTVRPINDQGRRAAAHPRLGAVHARRDPGAGGRRRSAPAAMRRSSTASTASARSRSCCITTSRRSRVGETGMMGSPKRREIGHGNLAQARREGGDARHGEVPVRHPRGVGNSRVQRLELDGLGLRHQSRADGRGRADQGAGSRRGDGPGQGRRAASRCSPTSSATRITSATWISRSPAPRTASRRCRWTSRSRASRARS